MGPNRKGVFKYNKYKTYQQRSKIKIKLAGDSKCTFNENLPIYQYLTLTNLTFFAIYNKANFSP